MKRIGRDRFVRNVLIALGNSGDPAQADIVAPLVGDTSPLVRVAAIWALGRLAAGDRFVGLRARHEPIEADPAVRAEWQDAAAA